MDDKAIEAIPCVSTGSLGIDIALGIGGFLVDESSKFTVPRLQVKQPSHSAIAEY